MFLRMTKSIATCIILLLEINLCAQTNYYLSTTGNNSNDGNSVNQAWKSIQYALDQLSSNRTLNIIEGTYNE